MGLQPVLEPHAKVLFVIKVIVMEVYLFFNVFIFVLALSFAIFLNTKAGEKWKRNL